MSQRFVEYGWSKFYFVLFGVIVVISSRAQESLKFGLALLKLQNIREAVKHWVIFSLEGACGKRKWIGSCSFQSRGNHGLYNFGPLKLASSFSVSPAATTSIVQDFAGQEANFYRKAFLDWMALPSVEQMNWKQ